MADDEPHAGRPELAQPMNMVAPYVRRRAAFVPRAMAVPAAERTAGGYYLVQSRSVEWPGPGGAPMASAVAALPETTVGEGDEATERECSVCLHCYKAGDTLRTMPCSHEFHDRCIFAWLAVSRLCPLCRFALPDDEVEADTEDEDDDDGHGEDLYLIGLSSGLDRES